MRSHYRWAALAGILVAMTHVSSPVTAQPPANWKPQTLSDAEEKK